MILQLESETTTSTSNSVLSVQIARQSMRKRADSMLSTAPNVANSSATSATSQLVDRSTIKEQRLCATWSPITGTICERGCPP